MTPLTEHFTLDELIFSSVAQRRGLDNTPDLETVSRLTVLAMGLERIRAILKAPMHIDSGYRCPGLNTAVGGAKNSAHVDGYAADFTCVAFGPPIAIVHAIVSQGLAFDQIIQEGTWVHVSFDPRARGQVLSAHFGLNGTTYTQGA